MFKDLKEKIKENLEKSIMCNCNDQEEKKDEKTSGCCGSESDCC
ncbi:hypothetical protein [Acidaminobacter sp. JC074]|nr:hypothetical protein [Acidaminobacter sp. JC074]